MDLHARRLILAGTMIRVNCSTCGKRLKCPEDAAGKSARCPKCGSSVALHSAAGADLPVIEPAETLPSVPVILMLDDDDPPKALPRRRRKKRTVERAERDERDERDERERDERNRDCLHVWSAA